MINELLNEKERLEEQKIMEAIHEQAKWNRYEEENKKMMKQIDKELNKKPKIKEVVLKGLSDTLLLLTTTAALATWAFVFYLLSH